MAKIQVRLENDTAKKLLRLQNQEPLFKTLSLTQLGNILIEEALRSRDAKKTPELAEK